MQQHRERDLNLRRIIYENIQHLILQLGDKPEREKPYPEFPPKKVHNENKKPKQYFDTSSVDTTLVIWEIK